MALHAYRSFLRVVGGMASQQRAAAVAEARSELAFFRDVTDAGEVARLVEAFDSRVAFLRMTTTRRRPNAGQTGATRTVYGGDGTVREKAKYTNWDGANMDPDSVARHNHSLKRAGFRDNAHAKGFF